MLLRITFLHESIDAHDVASLVGPIGRSPYEAMFSCPARLGVTSIGLPIDEIGAI
jgi:hypothetical protein